MKLWNNLFIDCIVAEEKCGRLKFQQLAFFSWLKCCVVLALTSFLLWFLFRVSHLTNKPHIPSASFPQGTQQDEEYSKANNKTNWTWARLIENNKTLSEPEERKTNFQNNSANHTGSVLSNLQIHVICWERKSAYSTHSHFLK